MKKLVKILVILLTLSLTACGRGFSGIDKSTTVGNKVKLGGIEWLVLAIDDGKALLLSDKILESRAFDSSSNVWETCDLRAYLNGTFFDSTFTEQEKNKIVSVSTGTDDKVFLLSASEFNKYMTESANTDIRNARVAATVTTGEATWWWLRVPGMSEAGTAFVSHYGDLNMGGNPVRSMVGGVRPVLWVEV